MATSGLARPDVSRRLAAVVTVLGFALCGLLLGAPIVAASATATPTAVGVRSASGPADQISHVVRDAEIGAATVNGAPQVVPGGAGAAAPAQPAVLAVPPTVFVGLAPDRAECVRRIDVNGVRGRAPPARHAPAIH